MLNVVAALPTIGGAVPLLNAAKLGWRPLLDCRAVALQIQDNAKLGRKLNFAPGKILLGGNSPRKCIYSVPAQETAKHRAKCRWPPPLSDVGAVMKPRPETHWNLLGCPKLVNWSQPLMGWSPPYCEIMWRRRYCCLTLFSDCRDMP